MCCATDCRPTDDDWAADFDCMYTGDLRKKLNVPTPPLGAPKLQLHRGFWSAYLAVDKQLMQEVNKQLKLVKVGQSEEAVTPAQHCTEDYGACSLFAEVQCA